MASLYAQSLTEAYKAVRSGGTVPPAPESRVGQYQVRYGVFEPCRVSVNDGDFDGLVVDMSLAGPALEADVQVAARLLTGTPITIEIERIGRIPATVVRPLFNGVAVEFKINRDTEDRLVAALLR